MVEILSSLLFPVYKLSRENTQPENMCDIVFEKAKVHGGTVNRTSDYAEAAVRSGSIKKVLWEILQKFIRKHKCQSLLLDKVRRCRSACSLKTRLQRRCFLGNFVQFLRPPFLQNTNGRLLLIYSSINSNERRIGKRNCKLKYTNLDQKNQKGQSRCKNFFLSNSFVLSWKRFFVM